MRGRSLAIICVVLVCIIGAFFPFESEVVPAWRLRVVDENGNGVGDQEARQSWIEHALDTTGWHEEKRSTDAEGYVTFPRRTVRASLWRRIMMPALNLLSHGGVGAASGVSVYNSAGDGTSVRYSHGATPPEQIVLPPLKKSTRDDVTPSGASPNNSSLPPPPLPMNGN